MRALNLNNQWQQKLAELATAALVQELELYPKAGLVSHVDSGSHRDMDYSTFLKSIQALQPYWHKMVQLGIDQAPFMQLVTAGKTAEVEMLHATGGINTHRGAIFIVGILVAACSYAYSRNYKLEQLPRLIQNLWGKDILLHRTKSSSHGNLVRQLYPDSASDIIALAANGFSEIFSDYLPRLKKLYPQYATDSFLMLFYKIMATLPDNNLLYRGGAAGLEFAQLEATQFIESGGIAQQDWYPRLEKLHREFIIRNLSPGGCADILAACIFVFYAEKLLWA